MIYIEVYDKYFQYLSSKLSNFTNFEMLFPVAPHYFWLSFSEFRIRDFSLLEILEFSAEHNGKYILPGKIWRKFRKKPSLASDWCQERRRSRTATVSVFGSCRNKPWEHRGHNHHVCYRWRVGCCSKEAILTCCTLFKKIVKFCSFCLLKTISREYEATQGQTSERIKEGKTRKEKGKFAWPRAWT